MKNLPINEVLEDIKNSFKTSSTLILQAPPGAGKSTVVPLSFLHEPWLVIARMHLATRTHKHLAS